MSMITVSNVSDGTLSIPTTYVTNGSAKAWVNFNGTGTIAARDSFNVSSLTDNGTGDYTVNFSSAFGAANYSFVTNGFVPGVALYGSIASGIATGSVQTQSRNPASVGALVDLALCLASAYGDLA